MVYSNLVGNSKHRNYIVLLVMAFVLTALLGLSWFGYSYYKNKSEQAASQEFAKIAQEYSKKIHLNNKDDLNDIEHILKAAAQKHKNSKLYPLFLSYQADALLKQNKYKEATEIFDTIVNSVKQNDPLYYAYSIKRALLKLDSKDAQLESQGYDELKELANNVNNPLQDMAIYNLGLNEFFKSNKDKAKELWQTIINKDKQDSSWYNLAKSRLESL